MAFKIFRKNCCGLDVHKTWIYACIGITDTDGRTEYKQARFSSFSKGLGELCDWLAKYHCFEVCMESTGKYWMPFLISWKEPSFLSFLHTPNIRNHKRVIKPTTRMPNGSAICSCVTWSSRPLSHLLTRHLRDLVRYRFKLTCMITGEKNRAQNCFTVSNLKLNDVFSDVLGEYSRFITEQLPAHPRNFFDMASFVDSRCKAPIEEIQAAVDGAISPEQAVKLRQCLNHIDELEKHINETTQEILRLSNRYPDSTVIH